MTKDMTREECRRLVHQYVDRCFDSEEGTANFVIGLAGPNRVTLEWNEELTGSPLLWGLPVIEREAVPESSAIMGEGRNLLRPFLETETEP